MWTAAKRLQGSNENGATAVSVLQRRKEMPAAERPGYCNLRSTYQEVRRLIRTTETKISSFRNPQRWPTPVHPTHFPRMTAREWPDSTGPPAPYPGKRMSSRAAAVRSTCLLGPYVLCKQTSSFPSPKAPGPQLRVAEELLNVIKRRICILSFISKLDTELPPSPHLLCSPVEFIVDHPSTYRGTHAPMPNWFLNAGKCPCHGHGRMCLCGESWNRYCR